eukprot:29310-Eustigmatos_ZCMA.PRE.1
MPSTGSVSTDTNPSKRRDPDAVRITAHIEHGALHATALHRMWRIDRAGGSSVQVSNSSHGYAQWTWPHGAIIGRIPYVYV